MTREITKLVTHAFHWIIPVNCGIWLSIYSVEKKYEFRTLMQSTKSAAELCDSNVLISVCLSADRQLAVFIGQQPAETVTCPRDGQLLMKL